MTQEAEKTYHDHLRDIYQGEEFSIVMFQTAADCVQDTRIRQQLLELKRLEECVLRLLRPLAEKHNIPAADRHYLERARQTGEDLGTGDWMAELKKTAKLVDHCITDYAAAVPLAPPDEQVRIRFAIAHEGAIGQFIAKELSGQGDPLAPVTDFIAAVQKEFPQS